MSKESNGELPELRRCMVGGVEGSFHRWVEQDRVILRVNFLLPAQKEALLCRRVEDLMRRHVEECVSVPNGCDFEVLRGTFALVEYPDGSLVEVKPEEIRFLDREEV